MESRAEPFEQKPGLSVRSVVPGSTLMTCLF